MLYRGAPTGRSPGVTPRGGPDVSKLTTAICVLLICVFAAAAVQAGTVIVSEVKGYMPGEENGTATLYLDKDRCRMEFKGTESHQILIYSRDDDNKPVLLLVDQHKWTYNEIKQKDVKKIIGQISDQMDQMDAYMKSMDAAQRDQMKEQFGSQIERAKKIVTPPDPEKYKFEAGDTEKVGEWDTKHYKCYYEEEVENELWIATWDDTELSIDDFAVLTSMYEEFGQLAASAAFFHTIWEQGKLEGFPVRSMGYRDGLKSDQTIVQNIVKQDLDSALFVVDDDYDKRDFFSGQ